MLFTLLSCNPEEIQHDFRFNHSGRKSALIYVARYTKFNGAGVVFSLGQVFVEEDGM